MSSIPVPGLNRAVIQAVQFGRSLADDVVAVHVTEDVAEGERVRARFERHLPGVPFVIVESPYRSLVGPFVAYLDVTFGDPESIVLVIIPEYVARALVGTSALQPDREATASGTAGPTRYGRGQRAIPSDPSAETDSIEHRSGDLILSLARARVLRELTR